MSTDSPVRVRFAPSPTGRFHIGSARTALYNYLIAQQTGGQFLLRIEDTDEKRLDPTAEHEIMDSLRWLGLPWDEGPDVGGPHSPYRQSERLALYAVRAQELVNGGHAYPCFCSPERLSQLRQQQQRSKQPPRYDGHCRRLEPGESAGRVASGESHVIRFKTPKDGQTQAIDLLRGQITVDNQTIDDYVLVKSNGVPVYHLAAMVDDHEMQISHVLRGSEWLPTFPLHVLIYQAFGWDQPVWVHLSVFLNPSGKGKLSKRQSGTGQDVHAVYITDMRQLGYLPEAINNWTALMGWSFDDKSEFFPIDELIDKFSLAKLKPSPAAVNFSKLDHFNGLHLRALPPAELTDRLLPWFEAAGLPVERERLTRIVPIIQDRIRTLDEAVEMAGFFFADQVSPEPNDLLGKNMDQAQSAAALTKALTVIQSQESIQAEPLETELRALADELGLSAGQLFGMLRVAVTGQRVSPPLLETMEIEGKASVVDRLERAVAALTAA